MKMKQGFSLIELLIVIGIIAILGGVMLSQFSGSTDSALAASCMNNLRTLCNAVLADAARETDYPAAGPFRYIEKGTLEKKWRQGWIGYVGDSDSCTPVSCYYGGNDDNEKQHHAITNGTIWRTIGGHESAYLCPAHTKYCKNKKKPTPAWSYVMNSYFGWDCSLAADYDSGTRSYGSGNLKFVYSREPEARYRSADHVLLFAEIPYVDTGVQTPSWNTAADEENDMVLQYKAETQLGEKGTANKAAKSNGEIIGFNHRSGKGYFAHVAFADGHCMRFVMPTDASKDNLINLTTWLCTGQEAVFVNGQYQKAEEEK